VPATPDPAPRPRLVLWDIDHTLIETRGVGSELYQAAFEQITGRPMEHKPEITGKTERAILAETLRLHGIKPTDELQAQYATALADQYEKHAEDLRQHGRALPGADAALRAITELLGVTQTVLTGNLRAVAATKLRTFGLDEYLDLDVGAYGDEEEDRPKLVPVAQELAGSKYGATYDRQNTIIIGDSPSDVQTASEGGAAVIAVASGKASQDDLANAGANAVLKSLDDPAIILDTLRRLGEQIGGSPRT
jgi:phosphoglycolate phosphatase